MNDTGQLVVNATVTSAGDITNLAVKTGQNEPDPNTANDTAGATASALPAADVALEKIVDRSDALVGETVTFTVRATNRGPSPATGVIIADTLPAGLTFVSATPSQGTYNSATGTWTVGSLDLQNDATLSIVTTADQPGALVNNAAVSTQDQFDPNPLNNSAAASVNAAPNADLRVTKAVSDSAPGVGTLLTYTVAVTNFGPSEATSATIHDLLPSGLSFVSAMPSHGTYDPTIGVWTIDAIPVTATRVLSITARVTAAGSLVNAATRQSSAPVDPNPANDGDDVTSAPALIADLAVTKTPGSPAVAAGEPVTWTIVVTNNGPSDVAGASVTDVVPAALTGVTWTCVASAGSTCVTSGSGSIATTVSLAASGTATFSVGGLVAPSVTDLLANTVSVAVPAGTTDPDLTNNAATSVVGVTAVADVQVTKTGPSSVTPGSTAPYMTTIINAGVSVAAGVSLGESTPAGLVLSTVGGACTAVPCTIGTLAPGESRVVTLGFAVPASYVGSNPFVVTATAGSASSDPNPANNSSSVATAVTVSADVSITKSGPTSALPGSAVTYMMTVTNAGPSDAASVTVSDPTPAGLTFMSNAGDCTTAFPCSLGTIPAGATRTITATFNVSRSPGPPASIANVATVASTTFDPVPANNTASAVISSVSRSVRCDIDGDGVEEIVTGAGPGGDPHVRVFNLAKGTEMASFYAYDLPFGGGVFVACGDVDGDGLADVITGKGPGGDPHVRAFSLASGSPVEIASFNAYPGSFAGGVRVAVGDINGDGLADIITGAGPGAAPQVRAFSLAGGGVTEVASFLAYDPGFTGGVFVAGGDVNGDGIAEIITGTYQGGGPVRVFDVGPLGVSELTSFFAYFSQFQGPVRVAVADVNCDGMADIITAAGPGGGPHVRAFSLAGGGLSELASFYAYDPAFCDVGSSLDPVVCDGVYVTGADVNGDGVAEIITGTNQGEGGPVRIFQVGPGGVTELTHFFAYFSLFRGPVRVAAADVGDQRRNSLDSPWASGREDRGEPSGHRGLVPRSGIHPSNAFVDRDSVAPGERGPPLRVNELLGV